jgi:hypothetical protein
MIECLANFENCGALPQKGGLLDQSPLFVEALRIWNSAGQIFGSQRERMKNMAKKLGAFNGRKK